MEANVIEIGGKEGWPGGALSNFSNHSFTFDGVDCFSMEGLLQALKFPEIDKQIFVCGLSGKEAKRAGTLQNKFWQHKQQLWWQGQTLERESLEFQLFLDLAFDALSTNPQFCVALIATDSAILKHSIGLSNPKETVLTEEEFCSRLTKIRERLFSQQKPSV